MHLIQILAKVLISYIRMTQTNIIYNFNLINLPKHKKIYTSSYLRFGFSALKAVIRNIPGIKYNTKGINNDVAKLISESLIR